MNQSPSSNTLHPAPVMQLCHWVTVQECHKCSILHLSPGGKHESDHGKDPGHDGHGGQNQTQQLHLQQQCIAMEKDKPQHV